MDALEQAAVEKMTTLALRAKLAAGTEGVAALPWFAVVNDLIGGWSVASVDKPASQIVPGSEAELAWGLAENRANLIAAAVNSLPKLLDRLDAALAETAALRAERDELVIAINGGCGCPAPYTECPHDEPLLPALNRKTRETAALRERAERLEELAKQDRRLFEEFADRAELTLPTVTMLAQDAIAHIDAALSPAPTAALAGEADDDQEESREG